MAKKPSKQETAQSLLPLFEDDKLEHWENIRRAMSGALAEKIESAVQKKMRQTIDYYQSVGWGNRPEIMLLESKYEASQLLTEVKATISNQMTLTGEEWGKFHTAEIESLLGVTLEAIRKARKAKSVRDSLNVFEYNSLIHCERDLIALMGMQKNMDARRLIQQVQIIYSPMGERLRTLLDMFGIDALTGLPMLPSERGQ